MKTKLLRVVKHTTNVTSFARNSASETAWWKLFLYSTAMFTTVPLHLLLKHTAKCVARFFFFFTCMHVGTLSDRTLINHRFSDTQSNLNSKHLRK